MRGRTWARMGYGRNGLGDRERQDGVGRPRRGEWGLVRNGSGGGTYPSSNEEIGLTDVETPTRTSGASFVVFLHLFFLFRSLG